MYITKNEYALPRIIDIYGRPGGQFPIYNMSRGAPGSGSERFSGVGVLVGQNDTEWNRGDTKWHLLYR